MNEQNLAPLLTLARSGKIIVRSGTYFHSKDFVEVGVLILIVDQDYDCRIDAGFWFENGEFTPRDMPHHVSTGCMNPESERALAERLRFICRSDIAPEARQVVATFGPHPSRTECSPFSPHLLVCYAYLLRVLRELIHQPGEGKSALILCRRFDAFVGEQFKYAQQQGAFVQFR